MAEMDDPTANLPDTDAFEKIRQEWTTFLDAPGGRAALLSAGIALMQPPSFGDTPTSQIGRALGFAGETLTRREALDIKAREAESKQDLRAAQADRATSQAETAGARAATQGALVDLKRQDLQHRQEQVSLQQQLKNAIGYSRYRQQMETVNANIRKENEGKKLLAPPGKKPELTPERPILGPQEWAQQHGGAPAGEFSMGAPPAPKLQPATQRGLPPAPRNPEDREYGKKYIGPNGRAATWTPDHVWLLDD